MEFLRVIDKNTYTKEATEIMSGDLYPTISQCYPVYFGIISKDTYKRKWNCFEYC